MSELQNNSLRRNILIIVPGLLLALAIISARQLAFTRLFGSSKKTSLQAVDEAAVRSFMEDATAMAPDLTITSEPLSIIERDRKGLPLTYLIEAKKTNEYWFSVTDYRLHQSGDWNALDPGALASAIDRAYEKRTTFPAEMAGSVNISATAGPLSGGVMLPLPIKAIGEMLGLIRGVVKLDVDRIDIAIKGYADGEVSNAWRPPVAELPTAYAEFPVLGPTDESKVNWLLYRRKEYLRTVTFPYSNADLPDLRAQFIRHDFVEDIVKNTVNASRCNIYVLHNRPLPDPNQEQFRKAQVYVMVYVKAPGAPSEGG